MDCDHTPTGRMSGWEMPPMTARQVPTPPLPGPGEGGPVGPGVPVPPLPGPGEGGPVGPGVPVPPLPGPGEGGPVGPGVPVPPLPGPGEGGPVGPGVPVIPLPGPGEGGPVGPGVPVPPLPGPGEGGPVGPGVPVIPLPGPGEGGPVANPLPNPNFAFVRFLNGVTDGAPLRVTLGSRLITPFLAPGNLTGYYAIPAGFPSLVLTDARSPWMVLYRAALPLNAREIITIAVVRSGAGLDLVRVDDRPCLTRGTDRACVRAVNLVYNSPGLDVLLTDGRAVFTDVRFKEVTTFRRARAGQYDMYIAQTPYTLPLDLTDIETVEDMPVVVTDFFLPGFGPVEPLASFFLDAAAGAMETIYLMGNWNRSHNIRVRVVTNP